MDLETIRVLERTKRCALMAKRSARERGNHTVQQQMEEIETLLDILDARLKDEKDVEE
mgnify:FL=1